MIRSPINAAVAAFLILGGASAHAEMIQLNITNTDPAYKASFGGITFDLNTAATTNTFTTGSCGGGTSNVYTTFIATGGVSNGSLTWDGVSYGLKSSEFFLDSQGACVSDLDLNLTFNNGATFSVPDQPSESPYSASTYTPSQMLATAVLSSYNSGALEGGPVLDVGGTLTGPDGFQSTATPVSEPGTLALFAVGLVGLAVSRRRIKV